MTRPQRRLYKRILKMLETRNAIFITMTFKDAFLEHTNAETRKRYIKAYLGREAKEYILNIDYGKLNNREHYHALVIANRTDAKINLKRYTFGNIKANFINLQWRRKNGANTLEETALYLMQHTIKETTTKKVIYSRCKKK